MRDIKTTDEALVRAENEELRLRVRALEEEVAFLRTHPVFVQGLKGESLVAKLTGGVLTAFAAQHDVLVGSTVKIEVKFSKMNRPHRSSTTRRWNWSKPLGWKDKGKVFDCLLLIGEKDLRFSDQYPDDSPYVYFLIPHDQVPNILTKGLAIGSNTQLITNLGKAKSPASRAIKKHMIPASVIEALSQDVAPGI